MLIDIHQHLVHGMDDGAQSFEETQGMLLAAREQGIGTIIATPHAVPGRERFERERYARRLDRARSFCAQQGLPIALHEGAEVFYTEDTLRLLDEGQIPTLAGSRYVLLEFGAKAPFEYLSGAARKLGSAGYLPVFAHIERCHCLRQVGNVVRLKESYQALMQMNARTLLEPYGLMEKWWSAKVLREGMIDLIASDAHNTTARRNLLGEAYASATQRFGEREARRMFVETPAEILMK